MDIATSPSEAPVAATITKPAVGEPRTTSEEPETQDTDALQVSITKAPDTADLGDAAEKIIDCPGDEVDSDLDVKHGTNLYYEAGGLWSLSRATPQQRRKQAGLRLAQSKAYAGLIEERISLLEKSVSDLQPEDKKTLTQIDDDDEVVPKSHSSIRALDWREFRPTFIARTPSSIHRPEYDPTLRSVIEILIDDPEISDLSISSQLPRTVEQNVRPVDFKPHQIRVRSQILLRIIGEITGCNTTLGQWKHKIIFIRPFKLLVYFEEILQNRLKDLEKLHPTDYADNGPEDFKQRIEPDLELAVQPCGPVKETESIEARDQLRLLCETVDTYLQPQTLLHGRLSAASKKVAFHDLWHIFRPGCEVRTRDPSQIQVYRVLKVTGGRPSRDSWRAVGRASEVQEVAARKLEAQGYSPGSFMIECFYVHYDGICYGPVNATFQIRKFDGERSITSLPVYPLACDENEQATRDRLRERGQEFASLSSSRTAAHRKYKGLTLDKTQELVESEIIVDLQLAFMRLKGCKPTIGIEDLLLDDDREYYPPPPDRSEPVSVDSGFPCGQSGCCGDDVIHPDYEVDHKARQAFRDGSRNLLESFDSPEQLTPEHMILLPPCVYGFVLRTRKWATFDIDLMSPPEYGTGLEQLVINQETKDTVLALVDNHERPRDNPQPGFNGVLSAVDLVQGKGRGLIILLHGEPGVGKTSTAECVAAHTMRPLFPITCGDIGHLAEDVEANLEQNFQLAHKWGCVLLLDEADIFLSTRTNDDIQRNAIVSVFLRTLEYYSGILFLTTNRVGKIDTAFKSRIHLSLYYKRLNQKSTLEIWENNLKRIKEEFEKERKKMTYDGPEIMEFAASHYKKLKRSKTLRVWNGRQIRNSFQTAIAIATYEARERTKKLKHGGRDGTDQPAEVPHLGVAHFEKVAKSAKQFDRYLLGLNRGANDSQIAFENTVRHDEFEGSGSDKDRSDKDSSKKRKKRKSSKRIKEAQSSSEPSSDEDSSFSSSASVSSTATTPDTSSHQKKKRKKH